MVANSNTMAIYYGILPLENVSTAGIYYGVFITLALGLCLCFLFSGRVSLAAETFSP
jgi:hypothetical protein